MTIFRAISIPFVVVVAFGSVTSFASDVARPPPQAEQGLPAAAVGAVQDDEACNSGGEHDAMTALQLGSGAVLQDSHLEFKKESGVEFEAEAEAEDAANASITKSMTSVLPCSDAEGKQNYNRIMIFRHAERKDGSSPLNECGWERAWNYSKQLAQYSVTKIYAFNYAMSPWQSKERCAQTASYIAKAKGHNVHYTTCNSCKSTGRGDCDHKQDELMHEELKNKYITPSSFSTILLFWEHWNIDYLLNQLTGEHLVPKYFDKEGWKHDDFDSYLTIYYRKGEPHHCNIERRGFGNNPCQKRKTTYEQCPECHEDKNAPEFCWKRSPTQETGQGPDFVCP